MLHLEKLGNVMETSIKEPSPPFFFYQLMVNGLLLTYEKPAKVNGLGIQKPSYKSQKIVNKSVKLCFTDNKMKHIL